ncbi:RlpA-like double-psi beta-barrel-protein domain-containing protein-containing protein [Cercophora newfieldiana]|uniref:cellulase n=1 Tax=Cercophora newfieldiana TaxID=92897 RepID=A0AA39XV72_9PEZI|nr:RlpA-like double-psi beta-barrel-protein domain-containing protein-containing protein [Cercophora newfieldiana]
MMRLLLTSVFPLLVTPIHAIAGKSYTTWDCCKPACGGSSSSGAYNKQTMIANDIIIYTPGGGVGPVFDGCRLQYGKSWGRTIGGVSSKNECANLPQNLQAGCYWRWNWARGDVNGWALDHKQIACPVELENKSGCSVP